MSPPIWKIAGVVSVALHDDEVEDDSKIDAISKVTGLSVPTIFQTLKGSEHLFDVAASSSVGRPRCDIRMKSVVRNFLLDESRSKDLYSTYRRSVILGCKSTIMLRRSTSKCKYVICSQNQENVENVYSNVFPSHSRGSELETMFCSFVHCGWDIRIDLDMQEGSPMSDLIEQLHVSFINNRGRSSARTLCTLGWQCVHTHQQFQWLCRQFRVSPRFITD